MNKHLIFSLLCILVSLDLSDANFSASVLNGRHQKNDEMEGKIVGGKPIPLDMLPYNVQIFNLGSMCAGSVLNSWTILTAAHCFDINKDLDDMVVQAGSRYVYDFKAYQFSVAHIVIHDRYNFTGLFACDIALVFIDRPIGFSSNVKKAVLVTHTRWMKPKEKNFSVSGWGWTQYGGPVSKEGLMLAYLRFIPRKQCSEYHKLEIAAHMFCLYGEGSKDTCKGDSGGGVFWKGMLVGITSHGDGCAKLRKPSVYVNVYHFRDWIKEQVMHYVNAHCRIS